LSLLKKSPPDNLKNVKTELETNAIKLVETLKSFGVSTTVSDVLRGPSVTRYELSPAPGVKISRITGLADDIALNLAASGVRIEAPIPNKAAVGIEVPNKVKSMVSIREMLESPKFKNEKSKLTVALGKDISGDIVLADLSKMPHLLVAGSTGSGKSVCINSMIMSILYKSSPNDVRMLLIDPKMVEFKRYNGIPHLLVPVVKDPKKASGALGWAVSEMLKRYKLFSEKNVSDMAGYNLMAIESEGEFDPMPQIVIIIDELADLMMAAPNEVEDSICRLAQMARAAGMHLVIATQRPSVDVITGLIKANIPSRIALTVSSQIDSRTILDGAGAEKLLGYGDMLFNPIGVMKPIRVQGCFISDKERTEVIKFITDSDKAEYDEKIMEEIEKLQPVEKVKKGDNSSDDCDDTDPMLFKAIECVVESGQASTSLLQRRLKLGYARAARIVDIME
ncbi:MAG: DNA translocase FtsK, partial [Oscillospiraceae bacterium]